MMNNLTEYSSRISEKLKLGSKNVRGVLSLLEEGATVPFIARYRKEATGSLDEVAIRGVRDHFSMLQEIDRRRQTILTTLEKHDLLKEPLRNELLNAATLATLEDIYLPYRPKRRTRAEIAREKGLTPLADHISMGAGSSFSPESFLANLEQPVDVDQGMAGARDILAERISVHKESRERLRVLFRKKATIHSQVVKKNMEDGQKYRNYFDWEEIAKATAGHRILAMLRGEREKVLKVTVRPAEDDCLAILYSLHISRKSGDPKQLRQAIRDSYDRLLAPSLETELRNELKAKADEEAIGVFADNLRELLLAAPLGAKRVMALDPGFRTGAKLVCLDERGELLHHCTIFPTQPKQRKQAGDTVHHLVKKFNIEAVAIGSGTAGRETETFIRELNLANGPLITLINEDGASIYSASELARQEFPQLDITVKGAISIGRRLQDPLAELVKIDPKAIGVGQYQHDVNQTQLKQALDDTVLSCVNLVGVEVNSASKELLTYVAGVGPVLAENIVNYRKQNGPFKRRSELLQVARFGPKAFQQSGGFLRIHHGDYPLDNTGVHPERYHIVEEMAETRGVDLNALLNSQELREKIDLSRFIEGEVGLPTLQDIMKELAQPGRDPREKFTRFSFAEGVHSIDDLAKGMILPAIITNVTKFGAFADIGVHQDGLIHISQLADRYIKDPSEVVKARQQVRVQILEIDTERQRISLSMRNIKSS